jgi:hypothetical protein
MFGPLVVLLPMLDKMTSTLLEFTYAGGGFGIVIVECGYFVGETLHEEAIDENSFSLITIAPAALLNIPAKYLRVQSSQYPTV